MYRYLWKHTITPQTLKRHYSMKPIASFIFSLLLLISCKNQDKLTFESYVLQGDECPDCPKVSITFPKAMENTKLASTINTVMEEEIISILNFDENVEASTPRAAITSFKNGYLELKRLYTDEAIGWEAQIEGRVVYEDNALLTLELNSYVFTGGAHGYSALQFFNFDKKKGKELENRQLFSNQGEFEQFAELKFREQEKIPLDKPINHTGFMFERDTFHLPENMGFTENGMQLRYNPYEVASYADGSISLTLPYDEIKGYLAKIPKP